MRKPVAAGSPQADRRLDGRVVVVTGASSGNGRAIALALADDGARVVCSDLVKGLQADARDTDPWPDTDTDDLVRERGGEASFQMADVAVEAEVEALARHAVERFGRIDGWVNNAGIATVAGIVEHSVADFRRVLDVNVLGVWLGTRAAVRQFRRQERTGRSLGRVVTVGSIAGEFGQGHVGAYAASKGAVAALTRDLAVELAPEFVNVNVIAPGYFNETAANRVFRENDELGRHVESYHPWPEMAPSSDLGRAVSFLLSDDAAWITGATLPVDGGLLAGASLLDALVTRPHGADTTGEPVRG
jgi:NAD(P)-dependent dehydrogenase (short-subunit alcohol dehydrogenase family)